MTGNPDSALAKNSDVHLDVGVKEEACILHLAPTSSTTAQIAMGDALAVSLMQMRGFTSVDFARLHPGGRMNAALPPFFCPSAMQCRASVVLPELSGP